MALELATRRLLWPVGELARMPHSDDPDGVIHDAMEEPIRLNRNLAMRQFRELGYRVPRQRMLAQLRHSGFRASLDVSSRRRALAVHEGQRREVLPVGLWCEAHPH